MHGGRKILRIAAVYCVACVLASCHKYQTPSSTLPANDPASASQWLTGAYPPETPQWRWLARNFSVALKPPDNTGPNGARLTVHLYVPDVVIRSVGPITLHAAAGWETLGSETFTNPGTFDFMRDISPNLLNTNILPLEFCFDKAMPPSAADGRELAAIVTSIDLKAALKP